MPANVSLRQRAIGTAGFANEVDDVNQYAALMYAPTAKAAIAERRREHPQITASKPNVATNSLKFCAAPLRAWREIETSGNRNIKWAKTVPPTPPTHCAATHQPASLHGNPRSIASIIVTGGLKCAPEIGPNVRIKAINAAPVAIVFARRAIATLPPASRSPMIPEPITAATRNPVPRNSDTARRESVAVIVGRSGQLLSG